MFERILKIGLSGFLLSTVVHASPIGGYLKGHLISYWGKGSNKKESLALVGVGGYQLNRQKMVEAGYTPPWVSIKGREGEKIKNAFTFVVKDLVPLKYYLNIYSQFGFSWTNKQGTHAPFVGFGGTYHWARDWHFDISWRFYSLLRPDCSDLMKNSFTVGVAYMVN